MVKAIIFDKDGVIIDSEPVHFEAHRRAFAEWGIDLSLEDYKKYGVSRSTEEFLKDVVESEIN